jgi:anti-sigma factor RsiW
MIENETTETRRGALSPFFCQNQLSEYMDGLLPASRADEVKKTLDQDRDCARFQKDLQAAIHIARSIPPRPLSHDLALQIVEASEAGRRRFGSRVVISRLVLIFALPVLIFGTAATTFPSLFPFLQQWSMGSSDEDFVRYFPLLQGANDLIEEQSNWLRLREPFKVSVWEEGGLSPEEFEKSFQTRSPVSEVEEEEVP